jgi:hypothetical protein
MAALDDPSRAFFKLFEDLILAAKIVDFYPYNCPVDFTVGDVVECSYMRGLYKIVGINKTHLSLVPLENDSIEDKNFAYVGCEFVKKVQINQRVMKVLYGTPD